MSAIDECRTQPSLLALASYNGTIGLYDTASRYVACQALLNGHYGGVTQLQFTPDGQYLLSGARQDNDIVCWDLRTLTPLCRFRRQCRTNQRLQFDLTPDGQRLVTPSHDNTVLLFDLSTSGALVTGTPPIDRLTTFADAPNSVSCHPTLENVLAVGTGERLFATAASDDDDSSGSTDNTGNANNNNDNKATNVNATDDNNSAQQVSLSRHNSVCVWTR